MEAAAYVKGAITLLKVTRRQRVVVLLSAAGLGRDSVAALGRRRALKSDGGVYPIPARSRSWSRSGKPPLTAKPSQILTTAEIRLLISGERVTTLPDRAQVEIRRELIVDLSRATNAAG